MLRTIFFCRRWQCKKIVRSVTATTAEFVGTRKRTSKNNERKWQNINFKLIPESIPMLLLAFSILSMLHVKWIFFECFNSDKRSCNFYTLPRKKNKCLFRSLTGKWAFHTIFLHFPLLSSLFSFFILSYSLSVCPFTGAWNCVHCIGGGRVEENIFTQLVVGLLS